MVQSADGVDVIVKAAHRYDALFAICDVYHDLIAVMKLKRGLSAAVRNYGSRFEVQMANRNANCPSSQIPEVLHDLLLLASSNVDSSYRIPVITAAASSLPADAFTT